MIILGLLLVIFSVIKLSITMEFKPEDFTETVQKNYKTIISIMIIDGLLGLLCGAFILFT